MAIEIMLDVWKKAAALNGTYLLLMLALADNGNDSRECWPSVTTLGKKIRMSESQTRRCLYALRDAGYITIQDRGAAHRSNLYTIASGLEMERLGEPRGENHWKGSTDDALALVTPRGSTSDTTPLALVTPDPSLNHQEPSSSAIAESPITPAVSVAANPPARKQRTVKKQPTPSATDNIAATGVAGYVPRDWVPMLAGVCGLDAKLLWGRLAKRGRELFSAGYTVEQVETWYGQGGWWYKNDWRGHRGQPPTAEQILATIALAAGAEPARKEPMASSGDTPWWAGDGCLMGPVQGQHRGNDG
jgi:hypothetical protein